jgi:hypothetical protein
MLCNKNYQTQYAKVNGNVISIEEYKNKEYPPFCINHNHELIAVQGKYNKWHFRHRFDKDISTSPQSEWHAEWQGNFENTEIVFTTEGQISNRRADIVEGDYVIEIQHSLITRDEVNNRNHDYKLNNKKIIWIIDGNSSIQIQGNIMTFDIIWKYDSFIDCEYIYIDKMGELYKINMNDVKSSQIRIPKGILKYDFIKNIKQGIEISTEYIIQNKLFIKQQGAGNGKTWGIINMIGREDFSHYTKFIYVTKQHSARNIIKEEFTNQQSQLNISNVKYKDLNKKYIIEYTNNKGVECSIIIATIDSFMYAVGSKTEKSYDMFEGIVNSIKNNHIETDIKGTIKFATINPKLNSETLYIVDETQDLSQMYAEAIVKIMEHTHIDVYVVGDKLQSISNEINAFNYFIEYPNAIIEEPINTCRRFNHPLLVDFVNHMVPFNKHNLLPITPWKISENMGTSLKCLLQSRTDNKNINERVDEIMYYFKKEVEEHNYLPEHFLIVTPCVTINPYVNALDIAINNFWIEYFENHTFPEHEYWKDYSLDNYYRYSIFHKSEEGTSINLDDSKYSTRIVSIHSSKGDGREVVFVIGLSEFKLKKFSGLKDCLKYDSLLHVAITRMKKSLYITYENDDIGQKIMEYLNIKEQDFMLDTINIKNNIHTRDIVTISGKDIYKLLKEFEFIYNDNKIIKSYIVDMSHHNIRCGIMYMKIYQLLENEKFDRKSQIKTLINIACNKDIIECNTWQNYNTILVSIKKTNKDKDIMIPILKIKGCEYNEYYIIINEYIKYIQDTLLNKTLCPLELIILYYIVEITQNGEYSNITMLDLYNIIYTYKKSYSFELKGHDKCLCKKYFKHNTNTTSFTDYLFTHYEKMNKLEIIINKLKLNHPNTSWNISHSLNCEGNNAFKIKGECSTIGYNDKNAILCYIKPELNGLNFNEIKINALIDSFILINDKRENNYNKYNGKKIIICIISLNLDEPYYINFEEIPDIKIIINKSLYIYYYNKNKDVFRFYKYYKNKGLTIPKIINKYDEINEPFINNQKSKPINPSYITKFLHNIRDEYAELDSKEEKNKFINQLELDFIKIDNFEEYKYSINKTLQEFINIWMESLI